MKLLPVYVTYVKIKKEKKSHKLSLPNKEIGPLYLAYNLRNDGKILADH